MSFSMGQTVEWTSQAAGTTLHKQGTIVEVVPVGKKPNQRFKSLYRNNGVQGVSARKDLSYVVEVDGKHYWPRVSGLRLVDTEQVNEVEDENEDDLDTEGYGDEFDED